MSELKCPFCNKPLQPTHRIEDEYFCENYDCPGTNIEWVGSQKLWQEFIRTRKALDVAVDALKEQQRWLGITRISMVSHLNNEKGTVFQPYDADPTVLNIGKAKVLLNNALEQITALEQKDK